MDWTEIRLGTCWVGWCVWWCVFGGVCLVVCVWGCFQLIYVCCFIFSFSFFWVSILLRDHGVTVVWTVLLDCVVGLYCWIALDLHSTRDGASTVGKREGVFGNHVGKGGARRGQCRTQPRTTVGRPSLVVRAAAKCRDFAECGDGVLSERGPQSAAETGAADGTTAGSGQQPNENARKAGRALLDVGRTADGRDGSSTGSQVR
jgi:hypothetical protein